MFSSLIKRVVLAFGITTTLILGGCNTLNTTGPVAVDANNTWVLLPINNLSTTPQAGEMLRTLLETELRSRGVKQIALYKSQPSLSLVALLDDSLEQGEAMRWGRERGGRYALTGAVHEWHYKSAPDKEPSIGVSLKLLDMQTNEVVWQGSGARTGWGYANLSSVGSHVIDELLDELKLNP